MSDISRARLAPDLNVAKRVPSDIKNRASNPEVRPGEIRVKEAGEIAADSKTGYLLDTAGNLGLVLDGGIPYTDYGPAIFGHKFIKRFLSPSRIDEEFSPEVVGYGIGYYKSDFLIDGEKWKRWHGFGVQTAFSYRDFIDLLTVTLSADANLGFGDGVEVNVGVGPTYSFGIPGANLILGSLIWGSLKVRGNATISGEGEGYAGWGVNPEVGYSISILTLRWVFPSLGGGGNTEQGNSLFAGLSHGWP